MPEHGTRARYLRGCRCGACHDANRRYLKAYRVRTRAERGRPTQPVRVPAGPVREHLRALFTSGWQWRHVEAEAGVGGGHLSRLLRVYATCHRDIAARILALEPLQPVEYDPVVVERLADGDQWRDLRATRPERLAAYELATGRGESGARAATRLGLAGRDIAAMRRTA